MLRKAAPPISLLFTPLDRGSCRLESQGGVNLRPRGVPIPPWLGLVSPRLGRWGGMDVRGELS